MIRQYNEYSQGWDKFEVWCVLFEKCFSIFRDFRHNTDVTWTFRTWIFYKPNDRGIAIFLHTIQHAIADLNKLMLRNRWFRLSVVEFCFHLLFFLLSTLQTNYSGNEKFYQKKRWRKSVVLHVNKDTPGDRCFSCGARWQEKGARPAKTTPLAL